MNTLLISHVKQHGETHCGVASLEMVYRYFDMPTISQDSIWEKRKTTRSDGTNSYMRTNDMVIDLVENDFQALSGQFFLDSKNCADSIKALLDANIPIIACIQYENDPQYGHFVVIIGIDAKNIAYLNPNKSSEVQTKSINAFLKAWQKTGEEVLGGEFIIMAKDSNSLPIQKLELTSFNGPSLKSFRLKELQFEE